MSQRARREILFNAKSPLSDLRAQFDIDIPQGGCSTLIGAIIRCLTNVPGEGGKVELGDYELRFEKMDGHKITQVSIENPDTEEDTPESENG